MNAKLKNSNGWILCPSKSFPGKFYYFNVLTGETAWSCDTDKRNLRNPNEDIHKVIDKAHTYPEPVDPPTDYKNRTTSNMFDLTPNPQSSTLLFNQPQNSYCLQEKNFTEHIFKAPNTTNLKWSPIKPLPIFRQIQENPQKFNDVKQTFEPAKVFQFGDNKPHFGAVKPNPFSFPRTQTLNSSDNMNSSLLNNRLFESTLNNLNTKVSFTNTASRNILRQPVLKKTKATLTSPHLLTEPPLRRQTSLPDSVSFKNGDAVLQWGNTVNSEVNLDRNDLRYKLVAKKRKSVDLDEAVTNTQPAHKKKVTFNLNNIQEKDSSENGHHNEKAMQGVFEESTKPTKYDVQDLANMAAANAKTDVWFIIPDVDVLIQHYDFLLKLLATAENSRMQISRGVHDSLCVAARDLTDPDVNVVRTVLRRLKNIPVDVQDLESEMIVQNLPVSERLLNFCMLLMTRKYHAVIITKDPNTHRRAKSLDLHCFTVDEISLTPLTREKEAYLSFEKIRETIQNDYPKENITRNLFLQSPDKISLFTTKSEEINFKKQPTTQHNLNNIFTKYNNIKEYNNNPSYSFFKRQDLIQSNSVSSDVGSNSIEVRKDFKNLRLKEQNVSSARFKNTNNGLDAKKSVFEPLWDELSNSNSSGTKSNETSNSNQPVSEVAEISKFYNRPVLNQSEVGSRMTNNLNIEDSLRMFRVTRRSAEERVTSRMDEWICCLTQIMEDALTEVLKDKTISQRPVLPAPWYFQEAVDCLTRLPSDEQVVKIAGVLALMLRKSNQSGYKKIKTTIKPYDFFQILGCSHLLLQALQSSKPHVTSLSTSINDLIQLLNLLKTPSLDPDPSLLMNNVAPLIDSDGEEDGRKSYVKKSSDVLEYVQKHFPLCRKTDIHTITDENNLTEVNFTRTVRNDLDRSIRNKDTNEQDSVPTKSIEKYNNTTENIRFIRKTNLIHAFENKLKIKEKLDLDALDYETEHDMNEIELEADGADRMTDVTDDSGDDKGALSFLFLKEFLVGLSKALKDVYDFILGSTLLLSTNNDLATGAAVHTRADTVLKELRTIVDSLEGVLSRELCDATSLKVSLQATVPQKVATQRALSYRSIIQQAIDQSLLLETCLQHLLRRSNCNETVPQLQAP